MQANGATDPGTRSLRDRRLRGRRGQSDRDHVATSRNQRRL